MIKEIKDNRFLASLALFRELYNTNKDIYEVISTFVKQLIVTKSKYAFNLTEITEDLNKTYGFKIPKAVVGTSLKRLSKFLTRKENVYSVVGRFNSLKANEELNKKEESLQHIYDKVIGDLLRYMAGRLNRPLGESKKKAVVRSFVSFIIDEKDDTPYLKYINAFVISRQGDGDFKKRFSLVREGVVLHSGIRYSSNLNELGSFKSDLTIFLDTEILFYLAGYDGELYQKLWADFFQYVKEINRKKPNRIKLRYFSEVNSKIINYFGKAEDIVAGKDYVIPDKTAMKSIVNGCQTKADVVVKRSNFFQKLKELGIEEDGFNDYFSERYHQYNIEDESIIAEITEKFPHIENPSEHLQFLNYINIRRGGVDQKHFESVRYILLSNKSDIFRIASDKRIKSPDCVPLAMGLDQLTNEFWFRLNKGLGAHPVPLNFDVITKAQLVLSSLLNQSIIEQYDALMERFKSGKITEEQAEYATALLRQGVKKPEEIDSKAVESIFSFQEKDLESIVRAQTHLKNKAEKTAVENRELKADLSEKKESLIEAWPALIAEKERKKKRIDKRIKRRIARDKIIWGFLVLAPFLVVCLIEILFDPQKWVWIFSVVPVSRLLQIFFPNWDLPKWKKYNPFSKEYKERITKNKYKNFDAEGLAQSKKEYETLKRQHDSDLEH